MISAWGNSWGDAWGDSWDITSKLVCWTIGQTDGWVSIGGAAATWDELRPCQNDSGT